MDELLSLYFKIEKEYRLKRNAKAEVLHNDITTALNLATRWGKNYQENLENDKMGILSFRKKLDELKSELIKIHVNSDAGQIEEGEKAAYLLFLSVLGICLEEDLSDIASQIKSMKNRKMAEDYYKSNQESFEIYNKDSLGLDFYGQDDDFSTGKID